MGSTEIAIIMGSDSDLPTMEAAVQVCHHFDLPCQVAIVSAHRTPARMVDFSQTARQRGLKVIIAGAGGAAHLPGMVAALTPLPVIGVPIMGKTMGGLDSLYSIVQMPAGIPVATVAIGNAKNAGLLAVQILAIDRPHLFDRLLEYRCQMEAEVLAKQSQLETLGVQAYLQQRPQAGPAVG
ncbi:MAG: 5-(carboxyamino)imidazole ribonucleotide mutase [Cyanobacteria bacterium REEB459]|nr:5-(carboxyamino)imidazole ribonucleotide mutase [Cyanobacteria bacterium REEB459]